MTPKVTILKVKSFNKKFSAFSLLEILVALVIVGVMISFPNWQSLFAVWNDNSTNIQREIKLRVLMSIAEQSGLPSNSVLRLELSEECDQVFIDIGAGGYVGETQFQCGGEALRISRSGGFVAQQ